MFELSKGPGKASKDCAWCRLMVPACGFAERFGRSVRKDTFRAGIDHPRFAYSLPSASSDCESCDRVLIKFRGTIKYLGRIGLTPWTLAIAFSFFRQEIFGVSRLFSI